MKITSLPCGVALRVDPGHNGPVIVLIDNTGSAIWMTMNELALFAGAGGGILGGVLLGWRTVCAVEIDAYARSVLLASDKTTDTPRLPHLG
jgi:hypothetical protein